MSTPPKPLQIPLLPRNRLTFVSFVAPGRFAVLASWGLDAGVIGVTIAGRLYALRLSHKRARRHSHG